MKKLLPLFFLLISAAAYSQPAVVTLKDGTILETSVSAISDRDIHTPDKQYAYKEIETISFLRKQSRFTGIYQLLDDNGIKVTFTETDDMYPQNEEEFKKKVLNIDPQRTTQGDKLYAGLENFRKSYQTGTALMAVGVGAGIISVLLASELEPEMAAGLSIVSGVGFASGIFVLANAGKHLKNLK